MGGTLPILFELLQNHARQKTNAPLSKALILDIFRTLSLLDSDAFAAGEESAGISSVRAVKHFLFSTSLNDIYLFLSCLECVDVINWAGTSPSRSSTLHAEDFEKIMQMLNISDQTVCRKASTSLNGAVNLVLIRTSRQ